ncbi:hypothetical protein TTHERM_00709700 (macronuclear) [Tetrahymena thermophila SB210]|uniref:Uncharacterized protein n=1 Tax=Tetrahymena thermophila (strain SB210) TaxID=312017 RepID=I7MI09_TETTS|nr:hypothetical protein TTHERM_00709700 [Tetrahymena thermophila SB210]EAR90758.2 hypothetical protein TTHERM_00709700 [Tetrahymena thermophila SB210]|eukprot:XP_001011003.2 hypothetical protein TTHERM_00709700 [Tetrahymena thermophila SB210]
MIVGLFRKESTKKSIYQQMYSQAEKFINIYDIYESLFQVKKAIKLMLSKDQYAALQFCGCDMNFDEIDNNIMQHKNQTIYNKETPENINNLNQEQNENQKIVLERISQTQENKQQNLQEKMQLIQIRKKEDKDIELSQNNYQKDKSENISSKQYQDLKIQGQYIAQTALIQDQEKIQQQQQLIVKNIFFSARNHLDDQDQIIDLNIFSSLIGQNELSQSECMLNNIQQNVYQQ